MVPDSPLHTYSPGTFGIILGALALFGAVCALGGFLAGRMDRDDRRPQQRLPKPRGGAHRARPATLVEAPTQVIRLDDVTTQLYPSLLRSGVTAPVTEVLDETGRLR